MRNIKNFKDFIEPDLYEKYVAENLDKSIEYNNYLDGCLGMIGTWYDGTWNNSIVSGTTPMLETVSGTTPVLETVSGTVPVSQRPTTPIDIWKNSDNNQENNWINHVNNQENKFGD